jgi:hypothetical protein
MTFYVITKPQTICRAPVFFWRRRMGFFGYADGWSHDLMCALRYTSRSSAIRAAKRLGLGKENVVQVTLGE